MIKTVVKEKINSYAVSAGTRLLCAVSGGIDSIVMLHLLVEMGYDCVVAHCNFKLRGDESDGDEQFVREMCLKLRVPYRVNIFDTHAYAEANSLSIQMAARELRYNWFYALAEEEKCSYIALAHNSDDQAETAILNLVRGTGIRGLAGMKPILGKLFRPLIEVSREEIKAISDHDAIPYHNDSTNATTKYARNKIRHLVLPLLQEINTAAKENILRSVAYFSDTESIMNDYIKRVEDEVACFAEGKILIDVDKLNATAAPATVLFELLIKNGVPKALASESMCLLTAQTGRKCEFANFQAIRNRHKIEIYTTAVVSQLEEEILIDTIGDLKKHGFLISKHRYDSDFVVDRDVRVAYLDVRKLEFPLVYRKWRFGDKFIPLGMKGNRKLSDFLKDEKLSIADKESVRVLESAGKIVWVVGLRIDNRFKIDDRTVDVYKIEVDKK